MTHTSYGATPGILSQDTSRPWGERVHEWRTLRGISIDQLAGMLKVTKPTLLAWERDGRIPKNEAQFTEVFQWLQVQAGESPGMDTTDRVAYLWRTHLRARHSAVLDRRQRQDR